ncbi:hypothetical protein [Streptomyces malaysiensis]|uniref:Cupin n=1 Tax=Streptomyces malaysiensis subsp. samsunensis TaxID=459658 RepID=A0A9X2M2H0_STRMQ|nr:hypothetical protein [Streptomyces samsunensis]MCQ8835190.1 hypothetical protein [Streptomyces samsunensis]WPB90140.1 hypothetical protein R8789_13410 [Streptomyces malaysiensis]
MSERDQSVGTELLFENDVVRVWRMYLHPGEACRPHMHAHDHVLVYANPSLMEAREQGGTGVIRQPSDEGFVLYREVGTAGLPADHWITNVGDEDSTHYIVELLGPSRSATSQPPVHNGRVISGHAIDW